MNNQPQVNDQPGEQPPVFCPSLQALSFEDFVSCECDLNYSPLIRVGNPTQDQLICSWIPLIMQFYVLSGADISPEDLKLYSSIVRLNTKLICVSGMVKSALIVRGIENNIATMEIPDSEPWAPSQMLITELREWGYDYPFTADSLKTDMVAVKNELVKDAVLLSEAVATYNAGREQLKSNGDLAVLKAEYLNVRRILARKQADEQSISPAQPSPLPAGIIPDRLYSRSEVCTMLKISHAALTEHARAGRIKVSPKDSRRMYRGCDIVPLAPHAPTLQTIANKLTITADQLAALYKAYTKPE